MIVLDFQLSMLRESSESNSTKVALRTWTSSPPLTPSTGGHHCSPSCSLQLTLLRLPPIQNPLMAVHRIRMRTPPHFSFMSRYHLQSISASYHQPTLSLLAFSWRASSSPDALGLHVNGWVRRSDNNPRPLLLLLCWLLPRLRGVPPHLLPLHRPFLPSRWKTLIGLL